MDFSVEVDFVLSPALELLERNCEHALFLTDARVTCGLCS
jgi:hypothetical protein